MRKLLYTAIAAAGLATASMSNAAVTVTSPSPAVYTPPSTGGFLGVVNPSAGATASTITPFNDTFNFTINGSPGSVNAQVSTILLNNLQNINFTSITLDGNIFTLVSAAGAAEQWACCGVNGTSSVTLAPGTYAINLIGNLTGNAPGSYSGTLNVQSVRALPEPATWAMMLLGFAGIGMTLRRRRRPVLAQLA